MDGPPAAPSEVAEVVTAQTLGFLHEGGRHKVLDVPVSSSRYFGNGHLIFARES